MYMTCGVARSRWLWIAVTWIPCSMSFFITARLAEREVRVERERWLDRHAIERDREVAAADGDAIDAARHFHARPPNRFSDRVPFGIGCSGRQCSRDDQTSNSCDESHAWLQE